MCGEQQQQAQVRVSSGDDGKLRERATINMGQCLVYKRVTPNRCHIYGNWLICDCEEMRLGLHCCRAIKLGSHLRVRVALPT